jgi:DNA repair protein RadC
MNTEIMATESFSHANMTYFFDYLQAANGTYYIKLTRSDRQPDDSFEKQSVIFFEQDFEFVLEAMSSLFRTAGYQFGAEVPAFQRPDKPASGIKGWEEHRRPREKLAEQGGEAMADAELVAMLIGSGAPRESAVALAGRILASVDFNLWRLSQLGIAELCAFRGMGHAKSSSVVAALELGKRLAEQQLIFSGRAQGKV